MPGTVLQEAYKILPGCRLHYFGILAKCELGRALQQHFSNSWLSYL